MKKEITLTCLNDDSFEDEAVELANLCPLCGHAISPHVIFASLIYVNDDEYDNKVFLLNYCPNCGEEFLSYHTHDDEDDGYLFNYCAPASVSKQSFSKHIQTLSSDFVSIYNEALQAENLGFNSICGIGYRKALEFLIKDYAIFKNPDAKVDIEKSSLAQCINTYIPEKRLQTLAKASTWLGNDQTHYTKKHTKHGLTELKQFINAFVTFIDADFAFLDAQEFITDSSN